MHTFVDLGVTRPVSVGDVLDGKAIMPDGTSQKVIGMITSIKDGPEGVVYVLDTLHHGVAQLPYAQVEGLDNIREWFVLAPVLDKSVNARTEHVRSTSYRDCLRAAQALGLGAELFGVAIDCGVPTESPFPYLTIGRFGVLRAGHQPV